MRSGNSHLFLWNFSETHKMSLLLTMSSRPSLLISAKKLVFSRGIRYIDGALTNEHSAKENTLNLGISKIV